LPAAKKDTAPISCASRGEEFYRYISYRKVEKVKEVKKRRLILYLVNLFDFFEFAAKILHSLFYQFFSCYTLGSNDDLRGGKPGAARCL
jgi:hypothetical protein